MYSFSTIIRARSMLGESDHLDSHVPPLSWSNLGLKGQNVQAIKPGKGGTDVCYWHTTKPCPRRGQVSSGMDSHSHRALKTGRSRLARSTNHREILCFVTGDPLVWPPKHTKSCSDCMKGAECSMQIFSALTEQSVFNSWSSSEGGSAGRVITWALNGV